LVIDLNDGAAQLQDLDPARRVIDGSI